MKNKQIAPGVFNMFQGIGTNQPAAKKTQPTNVFKYPYISTSDFKITMQQYEMFVQQYNKQCATKNQDVKSHNALVLAMHKAKKITVFQAAKENLEFSKLNNSKFTQDYNELVDEYNQNHSKEHGYPILNKRKYATIKWNAKLVFKAILGFYTVQIKKNNLKRMQAKRGTKRELERVSLNSYQLATAKKDDILLNDACSKTFQRHIKRFREAGILTHYFFINAARPVYCHINSQILAISDHQNQKIQQPQNQVFTLTIGTECDKSNHSTRTLPNKIEMKSDKSLDKRSSPALTSVNLLYKNTSESENLKKESQPPEIYLDPTIKKTDGSSKIQASEKNSQVLKQTILDQSKFAEQLHKNTYKFYKPIPKETLFYEYQHGLLNNSEFRNLVNQDLVKRLAELWKNSNFHIGSWVNALKIIDENWFVNFNGIEFDKMSVYNRLDEYYYRIKEAKKWFAKNPNFNVLYPSEYFKTNRKHSNEVGFMFTAQWWSSYISKQPAMDQAKRMDKTAHEKRRIFKNKVKRMQTKVRQVVAQKISLADLFNYVDKNKFPDEIIDMIPETIAYYEKI